MGQQLEKNSREEREDWEDKEFDQKSWTQGPSAFSCQALAESLKKNSTLKNLSLKANQIADDGAKAWSLVRMVRKKGIARSKIQAIESEVSEVMKGSQGSAEWTFIDIKSCVPITITIINDLFSQLAEHILGVDAWWFFTGYTLWWSDWLQFALDFDLASISPRLLVSKCEQTWG